MRHDLETIVILLWEFWECKRECSEVREQEDHFLRLPNSERFGSSPIWITGACPSSREFWPNMDSVCLQNRTAIPGRTIPYQHSFGTQPDINHVRIFGCAALAYLEKEKRHKLDFKTEECIYLGISPRHSHDTHTLLKLSTKKVIYRRNVSFNERSFPARIKNPSCTIEPRKGSHLIGQTFHDDGETFRVTNFSHHQGVGGLPWLCKRDNQWRTLFNNRRDRSMGQTSTYPTS